MINIHLGKYIKTYLKNNQGFSLMEVLISMIIFGVIFIFLAQVAVTTSKLNIEYSKRIQINTSIANFTEYLENDLKNAEKVGSDISTQYNCSADSCYVLYKNRSDFTLTLYQWRVESLTGTDPIQYTIKKYLVESNGDRVEKYSLPENIYLINNLIFTSISLPTQKNSILGYNVRLEISATDTIKEVNGANVEDRQIYKNFLKTFFVSRPKV